MHATLVLSFITKYVFIYLISACKCKQAAINLKACFFHNYYIHPMKASKTFFFLSFIWLLFPQIGYGQTNFWKKAPFPKSNSFQLEEEALLRVLEKTPAEAELSTLEEALLLDFPTPDGDFLSFRLFETPLFESLPDKGFLQYKTYTGRGQKNRAAHIKMEVTPQGISAFIVDDRGRSWFVNPLGSGKYQLEEKHRTSFVPDCFSKTETFQPPSEKSNLNFSGELFIYRLALSASGEYFQSFGNRDSTLAALVRTVNRMNLIFERDLAIRLQLIDDIQFIIFEDPLTDPFELNGNQGVANQQYLDRNVGSDEYDIGHVLMIDEVPTGFGSVGSVCVDGRKGRGYSVLPDPTDDAYIIDFLVHELGHQLGGNHTFSHCGATSSGAIPVEPGSGSTIMAYGGLSFCGADNFVEHVSPYFHSASIEEIYQFTRAGEGSPCPTVINFPNTAPEIELGNTIGTIPYLTPFELSATAFDQDEDTLSYTWEQMDQAAQLPLGQIQAGSPLFRSRPPVVDSFRLFPSLGSLMEREVLAEERLPDFAGELNFRLTVRDNHFRGGGLSWKETVVNVTDQAGPFQITAPASPVDWGVGNSQLIEWEVANTDKAPVGADQVDIYFVYDSIGFLPEHTDYQTVKIAGPVLNDGEAFIEIPEFLEPGRGRLKVKAHKGLFFDISDHPITLMLTVSDEEKELAEQGIRIFPNPARDFIFIEKKNRGGMEPAMVEWMDVYGRVLGQKQIMLGGEPVELEVPDGLVSGWYFVNIQTDNLYTFKIYIH
jgi:hypothetical protein